ncbi:MAG: MobC family plasmid mobilization relaxosome protein [Oscillospiraceae bacterium]|nr:MobC family plasmid mobilization relaxosome protein [Oscillospiraceae bacterium]
MRKRNCRVVVYFSKDELDALTKKIRKSHLSREGFIRAAVAGKEVKDGPTADVPALIQEVRRVGSNLNQIMKRANSFGLLDVPQLRKDVADLRTVEKLIVDAYTMPD